MAAGYDALESISGGLKPTLRLLFVSIDRSPAMNSLHTGRKKSDADPEPLADKSGTSSAKKRPWHLEYWIESPAGIGVLATIIFSIAGGVYAHFWPSASSNPPIVAAPPPPDPQSEDWKFWDGISSSRDARDYQLYLNKFPNGQFAAVARNRIEQLAPNVPQPATPSTDKPAPTTAPKAPPAEQVATAAPASPTSQAAPTPSAPVSAAEITADTIKGMHVTILMASPDGLSQQLENIIAAQLRNKYRVQTVSFDTSNDTQITIEIDSVKADPADFIGATNNFECTVHASLEVSLGQSGAQIFSDSLSGKGDQLGQDAACAAAVSDLSTAALRSFIKTTNAAQK